MSQSGLDALVESVVSAMPAGSAQQDFRSLMGQVIDQITTISPGGNWLRAGGVQPNSSVAPSGVSLQVQAGNGVYTLTVVMPNKSSSMTNLFAEISYCATKGFTSGVTTLPPSAATTVTLNLPGTTYFFRVRVTYDFVNWSPYALAANSASSSGLVSSAATSAAGAFNQTNYLNVDSVAVGGTANVRIYGTGGVNLAGTAVKGSAQSLLPAATIINVAPSSNHFIGWDGESYVLRPNLATVLADNLTPIGKVSVVSTAAPQLPTVLPVLGANGGIVAYNVTNGGAGATSDYLFTITDPGESGAGATTGAQTFNAGVLVSVAPGNPGQQYGANTVVTATGGTSAGAPGGGTAAGGNGGRLSAV